jgi:hypothetical protein
MNMFGRQAHENNRWKGIYADARVSLIRNLDNEAIFPEQNRMGKSAFCFE